MAHSTDTHEWARTVRSIIFFHKDIGPLDIGFRERMTANDFQTTF